MDADLAVDAMQFRPLRFGLLELYGTRSQNNSSDLTTYRPSRSIKPPLPSSTSVLVPPDSVQQRLKAPSTSSLSFAYTVIAIVTLAVATAVTIASSPSMPFEQDLQHSVQLSSVDIP
ncbi:hypothetical protein FRB90_004276 [Tulasnella sp. 427]|nr:hypothetical protein FRB90_004276 [Tulasnella sp. 427]